MIENTIVYPAMHLADLHDDVVVKALSLRPEIPLPPDTIFKAAAMSIGVTELQLAEAWDPNPHLRAARRAFVLLHQKHTPESLRSITDTYFERCNSSVYSWSKPPRSPRMIRLTCDRLLIAEEIAVCLEDRQPPVIVAGTQRIPHILRDQTIRNLTPQK